MLSQGCVMLFTEMCCMIIDPNESHCYYSASRIQAYQYFHLNIDKYDKFGQSVLWSEEILSILQGFDSPHRHG